MSPAEIALALRRSKCIIRYWLKKYGLGELEDRPTGSNGHRHPGRQAEIQQARLRASNQRDQSLLEEHGIGLSLSGEHYWSNKLGSSLKVPPPGASSEESRPSEILQAASRQRTAGTTHSP